MHSGSCIVVHSGSYIVLHSGSGWLCTCSGGNSWVVCRSRSQEVVRRLARCGSFTNNVK